MPLIRFTTVNAGPNPNAAAAKTDVLLNTDLIREVIDTKDGRSVIYMENGLKHQIDLPFEKLCDRLHDAVEFA